MKKTKEQKWNERGEFDEEERIEEVESGENEEEERTEEVRKLRV